MSESPLPESTALAAGTLHARTFGNEFLLLNAESSDAPDLPSIGRAMLGAKLPFVEEVIATEREICLKLNEHYQPGALSKLQHVALPDTQGSQHKPFRLPVVIDINAEDWPPIESHTGMNREAYCEKFLACRLRVAMIGFLPGFVYLSGLPTELHVPRKETPTRQTTPGALAIGGPYAGVYSLPSPAGWNVIGQIGIDLLQADRLPPIELQPGDEVTLDPIEANS